MVWLKCLFRKVSFFLATPTYICAATLETLRRRNCNNFSCGQTKYTVHPHQLRLPCTPTICSQTAERRITRRRFQPLKRRLGWCLFSRLRFVSPGARDNGSAENADGVPADVRAEDRLYHSRLLDVPHVNTLVLQVHCETTKARKTETDKQADRATTGRQGERARERESQSQSQIHTQRVVFVLVSITS